ncbi:MAG: hypothetical protein KTQ49_02445 [Candidatus Omnitrophica bacterium]|nr:hypothetical protein [Candidatus Omnitrophota bacterium]
MAQGVRRKIGEILIEDGLLTKEQLEEALAFQKEKGGLLGQALITKRFVDEDALISALGKQFRIPFLSLKHYAVHPDMAELLQAEFCHKHLLVPFDCDSKKVYLAVGDPMNENAVEEVRRLTGRVPQVFIAKISEILNAIYFLHHETAP